MKWFDLLTSSQCFSFASAHKIRCCEFNRASIRKGMSSNQNMLYTPSTLHWQSFCIPLFNIKGSHKAVSYSVMSHEVHNAGIWPSLHLFMSHHALCSNLLMPLTCQALSPCSSFSPLFLSLLTYISLSPYLPLTLPLSAHLSQGSWSERGVLWSQDFSFT